MDNDKSMENGRSFLSSTVSRICRFTTSPFTYFIAIAAVFSFLTFAHNNVILLKEGEFGDFSNYYFYTSMFHKGFNVYTLTREQEEPYKKIMKMPEHEFVPGAFGHPLFFYTILPFTVMDYRHAAWAWMIFNELLLAGALIMILNMLQVRLRLDSCALMIAFLVFSFQPLNECLFWGNFNIPILFLLAAALLLLKKNRGIPAGILLALAAMYKHQYGLLLLFMVWKKQYKVFLSAAATVMVIEIVSIVVDGLPVNLTYLKMMFSVSSSHGILGGHRNLGLGSLIVRFFGTFWHSAPPLLIKQLVNAANLLLVVLTAFFIRRKFAAEFVITAIEFSLAVSLVLIISPVVHEHHYVLLFMPFIVYWLYLQAKEKAALPWTLFIVSFLMLALYYSPASFLGIPTLLFPGKLYGTILLYGLGVVLLKKLYKSEEMQNAAVA